MFSLAKAFLCIHDLDSIVIKSICWKIIITKYFVNFSFIDKVDVIRQIIKHAFVHFSNP